MTLARKATGPRLLTANRLDDGLVVFLAPDGQWHPDAARAAIARNDAQAAALEADGADAVRANLVVGPYLVEITEDDGSIVPVEHRERRRLAGPSVSTSASTAKALAA
ncbi:MAG: DUF2849 domain-containing protein [Pseudomonadota bacterium]|nr:DUF2849 domain-containing protein [Pseudomonadota bacterium]